MNKGKGVKKFWRAVWLGCSLMILMVSGIACSGFSFGGVVPNDQTLNAPLPAKPPSLYGRFVVYLVGGGLIRTLPDQNLENRLIDYRVTELKFNPSMNWGAEQNIYDITHPCGDGYDASFIPNRVQGQNLFYKDLPQLCNRDIRQASDHPKAITLNNKLYFFYTNYPAMLPDMNFGGDDWTCTCLNQQACHKLDGQSNDFTDVPNGSNQDLSTTAELNCYFIDALQAVSSGYDQDWIKIPVSQFGLDKVIPLKIKVVGDQLAVGWAHVIQLNLFETDSGGTPNPTTDKPVASNRFGFDMSRMRDPTVGVMAHPDRDYWLQIVDWEAEQGIPQTHDYPFFVVLDATPALPMVQRVVNGSTVETNVFDDTTYIYRAGVMPARSGNPKLNDGSFTPDDISTKVEDLYPDCDGIPNTGDEGDWGIYEICPVDGETSNITDAKFEGVRDGYMEYWEVDDRNNIDDGNWFHGVRTDLPTLGDSAFSIIKEGNQLWMFMATGDGIFQLKSKDGLKGLEWDLSNIHKNRPSLLPRSLDPNLSGDPDAPVVSSGRYGICDTKAQGDDVQLVPRGKGYPDTVCITFGSDGALDSYAMGDEQAQDSQGPMINSGQDGVINSWLMPSCVSYDRPVFNGYYQVKTEAPGNPDLFCADSVTGANDESAFLLGDDQWATSAIGLNPPEYWRAQNCNPFMMGEEFTQCALGGKSNAVSIVPGGDGRLHTAQDSLAGDDQFCHQGDLVGICPGNNKVFDQAGVEQELRILKNVAGSNDELCEINPAGGLEYARFKYGDTYQLKHGQIVPGSEVVVSWYLAMYKYMRASWGWPALASSEILVPGTDYNLDPVTGEITMLSNNWLQPLANLGFDASFYGNPDNREKDVLIVYYSYNGSQVGVCPGTDGVTNAKRYFYASYAIPDHFIEGPPLELSSKVALAFGRNRINVPRLGDTYVPGAHNVKWNLSDLSIDCMEGNTVYSDCPISPGSDNSLDGAWALDAYPNYRSGGNSGSYNWPPNPGNMYGTMTPIIAPHRYDLHGQYDDWLCPINGQWALCPGGNGYFQIYQLWQKVEIKKYSGVDDVLANYKQSDNPCNVLETQNVQDEFYGSPELQYIQYAYRGVMEDDQVIWNGNKNQYQVTSGTNGINESCVSPDDTQYYPRYHGVPFQKIIGPGSDGQLETQALQDNLTYVQVPNERPIPKITAGDDGICNSFRIGDDRMEIFFGTAAPDYPCVAAGPNGKADTVAQGNDTQLYLKGEKTGFDSFQVDTPEIVQNGDKLYLYYAGLGWLTAPKGVPPSRGQLSTLGECKRPGLDNRWGNLDTSWSTYTDEIATRSFVTNFGNPQKGFYDALDDNQGVLLAPRIGVATSTVDRINRDPSDWDRNLEPAVDAGRVCQGAISASSLSLVGGLLGMSSSGGATFPPSFNYLGGFSPEVLIRKNDADNTPTFMMFLTGIYMLKSPAAATASIDEWGAGLYLPYYQIGLARSTDGLHFDIATDLNPLMATGDLYEDLDAAMGLTTFANKDLDSFLNATIISADNDSYGMIFKHLTPTPINSTGRASPDWNYESVKEHLGFAVRTGAVYSGGLAGLISCNLNPSQIRASQGWFRFGTSALLLFPLAGFILFKLRARRGRNNH